MFIINLLEISLSYLLVRIQQFARLPIGMEGTADQRTRLHMDKSQRFAHGFVFGEGIGVNILHHLRMACGWTQVLPER